MSGLGLWVAGGGLTALWLLSIAAVRIAREPRNPTPAPPADISRDEPPAVVNLLVENFDVSRRAVPATALDLAARGEVAIEHVGPEHDLIRVGHPARGRLTPYEAGVLELLRTRAAGGTVPVAALGTGPQQYARGWWRSFRGAVIRDAQARGLSRDLWDRPTLTTLGIIGLIPAPVAALAAGDFSVGVLVVAVVGVVLGGLRATRRQRETPQGMAAASAWLGVRRSLEQAVTLEEVPPSGVVVWERRLAYAAAMGLARAALRAMPMGADDERRAWSSQGGTWRRVRIRYPLLWPPAWGWPPWAGILVGLILATAGAVVLRLVFAIGWPAEDPLFPGIVVALRVFVLVLAPIAVMLGAWGVVALARGLLDLSGTRRLTGQVLRIRRRGGDSRPRFYVAIDDGSSEVVRAVRVPGSALGEVREYEEATGEVTPYLRHVRSIHAAGPA